jgi:Tfp pilus assembly protein PilX
MIGFFAFMVIVVLGILALVGGLQWISDHRRAIAPPEGDVMVQLERMETALTALESRLDDLQDQQRFLERLLAKRPAGEALPPGRAPASEEDASDVDSILFDREGEER